MIQDSTGYNCVILCGGIVMKLLHQGNHQLQISYRDGLDFPPHLHNAMELVFLCKGCATVLYGNEQVQLQPGDVFLSFPNQVHGYENSSNAEGYVLIVPVNPYLTAFHSAFDQKVPVLPVLRKGQWEHTGAPLLLEMLYNDWGDAAPAVISGYLLVLIGKLLPLLETKDAPAGCADALQAALLFLNEHYQEPLTRSSIAKALGYNESYLSHIFSDTLKTTLTDYIASLRINDSLAMLSDTCASVSQIALSLGFGSIRSFNRAFLRQVHMTPSAYRTAARKA